MQVVDKVPSPGNTAAFSADSNEASEISLRPKKLLQGTLVLMVGQITSYGLSFLRNIILARMLAKADFGLAAVFSMSVLLLEVAGRMSFGQQIIQSRDGDGASFQASSHAFQCVLALGGALLVLAMSHPLSHAFRAANAGWAFALLALVPLAKGFEHLDYYRQQREMNYLPGVLCEVVPQALATLAAWPLAARVRDYRVIVVLMVGKAVLGILMTHVMAKRPYRWAWQKDYIKRMWTFGWPLLLTGLLMFAGQQADQLVVGTFLTLDSVAHYALALSLVSIPWFVFSQVASSLMLPVLSRVQNEPEGFCREYRSCVEYAGVGAVLLTLPLIGAGEQIVTLFYGPKYAGTGLLMAILGTATAVRFLRFVPAVGAMARADTMNQLYSNLWRGLSLPLAAIVAAAGGGVIAIAGCALVAELMAGLVSLRRLRQQQNVPLRESGGAAAYVLGSVAVGLLVVLLGASRLSLNLAIAVAVALVVFSCFVAWMAFPRLTRTVLNMIGSTYSSDGRQPAS
jgi:O-antigen/teichoic acid export membrane protein